MPGAIGPRRKSQRRQSEKPAGNIEGVSIYRRASDGGLTNRLTSNTRSGLERRVGKADRREVEILFKPLEKDVEVTGSLFRNTEHKLLKKGEKVLDLTGIELKHTSLAGRRASFEVNGKTVNIDFLVQNLWTDGSRQYLLDRRKS